MNKSIIKINELNIVCVRSRKSEWKVPMAAHFNSYSLSQLPSNNALYALGAVPTKSPTKSWLSCDTIHLVYKWTIIYNLINRTISIKY